MSRLFAEALKGGGSESSPRGGQAGSPTPNRTVDELRRQLLKVKGDLEVEKQKVRQLTRSHAGTLKEKKEEMERKHRQAMDQAMSRKDQEKVNELKLLEEKLTRQKELELRKLQREKTEEMKETKAKLTQEHELKLRSAVDAERQCLIDQYGGEDPSTAREAKLAREVFMRTEECESVKSQVRDLREENKNLLDQLRQATQNHEASLMQLQKQGKAEAAREVARLQLAERRLMERDQEVSDVEQRVGFAEMEKKSLLETIEKLKGEVEAQQKKHLQEMAASPSSHAHSQLQKRCSELESANRKLEEQAIDQRQETASLRKKLSVASSPSRPSSAMGTSSTEDLCTSADSRQLERKLHDYRRRNKELLTLAKQLDGRLKALQIENESLMESKNRNTTETEKMLRKQFVKQQIKDREDHKRELRAKDRELEKLKAELDGVANQVARAKQVEAESAQRTALDSNFKVLSRERLQMELLMAKLVRSIPERDTPQIHASEMMTSKKHLESLEADNEQMKSEVAQLREQLSKYVDSDSELENRAMKQQVESLKTQLEQQASDADAEVAQLTSRLDALSAEKCVVEEKCSDLMGQVDLLKRTSDEGERTVAELASLNQKIRELKKECDVLRKSHSEASEARKSSEVECKKLQKELSRVKELRELIKTKDEEKLQLEEELDAVKAHEESARAEVDRLREALDGLTGAKVELEAGTSRLQTEVTEARKQLSEQRLASEALEMSLNEANNRTRQLTAELERVTQQLEEASKAARATPATSTKEVQCDLFAPGQPRPQEAGGGRAPATSSPKLAGRSAWTDADPEAKPRSPLMASKTKSVAGVTSAPKDVMKQGRSVSVPSIEHSASRETPPGRHSITSGTRNVRPPRPRSGSGRRSAGSLINRGMVPPYILAQGGSLQSELMSAGEHIDDVFDSEAVNITESEFLDDLETTQSNISLDGLEGDSTLPRNNPPSPTKYSAVSLHGGEAHHAASLESPSNSLRGLAAKVIHQLPGGSGDDDIIEVCRGLARVEEEESPSVTSPGEDKDRSGEFTDLPRHPSRDSSPTSAMGFSPSPTPSGPVSVFKALYSYDPGQMSPNSNPSSELALQKGQVLLVFGDMGEDGFYFGDSDGQRGYVPSNYVEKIRDVTEEEVLNGEVSILNKGTSVKLHLKSDKQGLTDENFSNNLALKSNVIYPPSDLTLERQFVDYSSSKTYKAVVSWTPPLHLPTVREVEYRVYVNGHLYTSVPATADTKVLLSDLPLHDICSIVVRTAAGGEESADPASPLLIGAKFPSVPVDLALRNDAASDGLLLSWRDGALGGTSLPPATHYHVSVNDTVLARVEASDFDGEEVCSVLLNKEMLEQVVGGKTGEWHFVAVRALHNGLESRESDKMRISPLMLKKLVSHQGTEDQNSTHVQQNGHSPKMADKGGAKSLLDYAAEEDSGDEESASEGEGQAPPGRGVVTNLLEMVGGEADQDDSSEEVEAVMFPQPRYYRALNDYHPQYMSENTGREDEELGFLENDIIKVIGMEDSDWLIGQLKGQQGVVPVNLITEVTDPQEIKRYRAEFSSAPHPHRQQANGQADGLNSTGRKMKALYDYDPEVDSPNGPEAALDELQFSEGDVIVVFGGIDETGFYTGVLNNRRGLVPSNFLEPLDPSSAQTHRHAIPTIDVGSDDDESDIDSDSDIQMFSLSSQVRHGGKIAQGVAN